MRGGWRRGGVPTPSGTHPWLGVQQGWGRPWGRWGLCRGMVGNAARAFPVHLGTEEPVGLTGLILCSLRASLLLCRAQAHPLHPHPGPYLYTRRPPLRTPPTELGLNPTHTSSPRALPPNSGAPHSGGPPLEVLPLSFHTGPKQRHHPMLEHCPT